MGFFGGTAGRSRRRPTRPWLEDSLHGRMIWRLLGHALDSQHVDVDFNLTHLTLDYRRPARYDDVTITTSVMS